MKLIDFFYKIAQDKSEYIIPREMFENALFFNTACMMGTKNIRIKMDTNYGEKIIIPNYYGITFGPSGMGKNHVLNLTKDIYADIFKLLVEVINKSVDDWIAEYEEMPSEQKKVMKLHNYYVPIGSSHQGIQKIAQTLHNFGKGSVNLISDELGDSINKIDDIFIKLKTAWDDGVSEGTVNVGDNNSNYFTVEDICYNAMLFGSPAPFELDPKKKDKLLEIYVSGMARRSFIYHNDHYKKSENRNKEFHKLSKSEHDKYNSIKKELVSFILNISDKQIVLPTKIKDKLSEYDIQKELSREDSMSLISESLGNVKKIEKLLGIIAVLDMSEVITEEHLQYAIDFTERMDATAEKSVEPKTIHESIYDYLCKCRVSPKTSIIKNIKGLTAKDFDEHMELVKQLAEQNGNTIVEQIDKNVVQYKVKMLSNTNLDKLIMSINEDTNYMNPEGFIAYACKFDKLHTLINQDVRYSAGTFLNGYIKNENYEERQNMIMIDIDEGLSIEDVKTLFKDYYYLISTTKSHQKEKNGFKCDRFRLILPTASTFHLKAREYSEMYQNMLMALGLEAADPKVKNASRWYYGNPNAEYYYNNNPELKLLDIRPFIPDSTENKQVVKNTEKYESKSIYEYDYDGSMSEEEFEEYKKEKRLEGVIRWYLNNTFKGCRNDMLFKLGCMLRDPNVLGLDEWESIMYNAANMISEPLPERDIQATINSVRRKFN